MNRLIQTAVGILAVALLAACIPTEDVQDSVDLLPANLAQTEELNITSLGKLIVSAGDWHKYNAVDGDPETWWSADDFAPQSLTLQYNIPHLINRIVFSVSQVVEGPTTHEVWLKNDSGVAFLEKRFANVLTADGENFTVTVDPPQRITEVSILVSQAEGWVALREVRVSALTFTSFSQMAPVLELPVQLTHAGDGSGRMFVSEKPGRIRIIREGALVQTPFLDISERVLISHNEQGFFNVAFPPTYLDRQQFYVSYTDMQGNTVISRFTTSANPDIAHPTSEEIILVLEQEGLQHNGGSIIFGPRDGYIYISSGDGTHTRPEFIPPYAQDPALLLGKILRIDVESGARPYAIPPDNPFVSTPGYAPEIWALGLRNPWGIAFDRITGDLYIPDTGWFTNEEVNFQPADSPGGENYGWPMWEGVVDREGFEGIIDDLVPPVATHGRHQSCAIVGGAMYKGAFIYSDFCAGRVWALRRQGENEWALELLTVVGVPVSSIGTDESGSVYVLGYADGKIYKLDLPW